MVLFLIRICAAQTASDPVKIVTHIDIIPDAYKPQSEENAAKLLRSQRAATQHDAGLISYAVLQQNGASKMGRVVTSRSWTCGFLGVGDFLRMSDDFRADADFEAKTLGER